MNFSDTINFSDFYDTISFTWDKVSLSTTLSGLYLVPLTQANYITTAMEFLRYTNQYDHTILPNRETKPNNKVALKHHQSFRIRQPRDLSIW